MHSITTKIGKAKSYCQTFCIQQPCSKIVLGLSRKAMNSNSRHKRATPGLALPKKKMEAS